MRTDEDDNLRRTRLRAVFDALSELGKSVPSDEGWSPMDGAVAEAKEVIHEAFDDFDIVAMCEGCSRSIISGDKGTRTSDDCTLCEECAPSWGDVESQWLEGREEDEYGERASFDEALKSHLESGGQRDDKPLYILE